MTEPKLETFAEIAGWLKAAPVGGKVKVVPETGEAPGIIKRDKTGWYWDDSGTPFSLHNVYIAATFQRIEENPHPKGTGAWAAWRFERGMKCKLNGECRMSGKMDCGHSYADLRGIEHGKSECGKCQEAAADRIRAAFTPSTDPARIRAFVARAVSEEREQIKRLATHFCPCGGSGPGEGCNVCDFYHAIRERGNDETSE